VGGINTITGAMFGAFTIAIFPEVQSFLIVHAHLPEKVQLQFLLTGLAAISVGRDPDGLGGRVSQLGAKLRSLRGPSAPSTPRALPQLEEAQLVHS
jgi:ABC-type branched-subunit amino acid transport system permease subunit